jgi:hypothetical protein
MRQLSDDDFTNSNTGNWPAAANRACRVWGLTATLLIGVAMVMNRQNSDTAR